MTKSFPVASLGAGVLVFVACVGEDPDTGNGNGTNDAGTDTSSSSGGSSSGSPGEDAATDAGGDAPIDSGDAGKVRYVDRVMQDGPVAYYRLDEAAGIGASDSAGNNDGNYYGTYTLAVVGALSDDSNTAVSFTNGCMRAGDVLDFDAQGSSFTLEAWVKPTGIDGVRVVTGKFNAYSGSLNGYKLQLMGGNKLRFVSTSGGQGFETQSVVAAGKFTHVVATHDGTTGRIYIDGVEAASGLLPLPPNTGIPFTVGCDYDTTTGNTSTFDGVIDEVTVFDKALSASTISQHFQAR